MWSIVECFVLLFPEFGVVAKFKNGCSQRNTVNWKSDCFSGDTVTTETVLSSSRITTISVHFFSFSIRQEDRTEGDGAPGKD